MNPSKANPAQYPLTQYSHGAGCGCKISPATLDLILKRSEPGMEKTHFPQLLVGHETKDDAAAYALGEGKVLVSTTDFFMPIVDDPFDFGRIASVNALSDVYAMGAKPLLALAILGWPITKIPAEIASEVLQGARAACLEANIPLAGGHSIDSPEPIFGLSVNGIVSEAHLKRNDGGKPNCWLYLTKPLGVGILTTAQKKRLLRGDDMAIAIRSMTTLNKMGEKLGALDYVKALTDVTGFGLLGHLLEMCEGSGVNANLFYDKIPLLTDLEYYLRLDCIPGGTERNWQSYGHKISGLETRSRHILSDPQTSGGLLIAIEKTSQADFENFMRYEGIDPLHPIGELVAENKPIRITVLT